MGDIDVKLWIEGLSTATSARPIFGEDIKIISEREKEQIFNREKIEGTFKFLNKDFDLIMSCGIETKFTLRILRDGVFLGSADFFRTDCDIDFDNRILSVKLTTTDRYEKILNSYDNKYNLVRLAPTSLPVKMTKRPILQFYVLGSNKLTNVVGGTSWEQGCREIYDETELSHTCFFSSVGLPMTYFYISNINPSIPLEVQGRYELSGASYDAYSFTNTMNPQYYVTLLKNGMLSISVQNGGDNQVLCYANVGVLQKGVHHLKLYRREGAFDIEVGYITYYHDGIVHARIIFAKAGVPNSQQRSMDNDIIEYNSSYPYVNGVNSSYFINNFQRNGIKSIEPTQWGADSEGKYFTELNLTYLQKENGVNLIPIGRTHWENMSSWLLVDDKLRNYLEPLNADFTLRDAYTLDSAISVLLGKVSDNITFGANSSFSQCLYESSSNDLMQSYQFPSGRGVGVYLTPITNVKKTNYEQAAQRGDISLKQILDMLRKVYRIFWWIDDSNRLRLEHIVYFKNGGTYSDIPLKPSIDLTSGVCLPNKKVWEYDQNKVKFEADSLPSRYEFKWGESCTQPFNGVPIDFKDRYLESGKKESISVDNFISDIDYTIINGSEISNDIYVVFEVKISDGYVPMSDVRLGKETPKFRLQNAFMSFLATETLYYPYDMSGWNAWAEDVALDVVRTREFVKQDISFPCTIEQMRNIGLAKTSVGRGLVSKMETSADTLYSKATIEFESEMNLMNHLSLGLTMGGEWVISNNSNLVIEAFVAGTLQERIIVPMFGRSKPLQVIPASVPVLLGAKLGDTPFRILRYSKKAFESMVFDDRASRGNKDYVLEIKSTKQVLNEVDFAMVVVKAEKPIRVTIQPNTTASYDFAYADTKPYTSGRAYTSAKYIAQGTNPTTFTMNVGEIYYIGYIRAKGDGGAQREISITISLI